MRQSSDAAVGTAGIAHQSAARHQLLSFSCRNDIYAIPLERVREIIELGRYTRVPLVPDYIFGIINLRGNVVPVFDLGKLVSRSGAAQSARACIMVTEIEFDSQNLYIGILIDEVRAVMEIADHDIEPAPAFGAGLRGEYLKGMMKFDIGFIKLLDLDVILDIGQIRESVAVLSKQGTSNPE